MQRQGQLMMHFCERIELMAVRPRLSRAPREHLPELLGRLLALPDGSQGHAQIHADLGVLGPQFYCFAEGCDRFLHIPGLHQRSSQAVVGTHEPGVEFDRPPELLNRFRIVPALLIGDP